MCISPCAPFILLFLSSSHSWWRWRNGSARPTGTAWLLVGRHCQRPHAFSASPRRSLCQNRLIISRDGILSADLRFAASRPKVPAALCGCSARYDLCGAIGGWRFDGETTAIHWEMSGGELLQPPKHQHRHRVLLLRLLIKQAKRLAVEPWDCCRILRATWMCFCPG